MNDRFYLIPEVKKNGFHEVYRNLVMKYEGADIVQKSEENDCFKTLCPENIKDYQKVENAAFLQAPNGGAIEDEELQDYLDEYYGSNLAGIYYEESVPAGVYTLKIKNNIGLIESIGVNPEFHRRGIGRKLLHKSILVLQNTSVEKVVLSVFNNNTRAVGLYLKDGFVQESEHSIWFEK
jgi:ribosomal protein S18 acetylase RimI-like enzyme